MDPSPPSQAPPPPPWARHPTRPQVPPEVLAAAIAGVAAVVLGFVGLVLMTTTDLSFDDSVSKFHGEVVVFLAVLLAVLMLGLAFTAGRLVLWPLSPLPLVAALASAASAVGLAIVGLVKSYAHDISVLDGVSAWIPYAEIWALVAASFMVAGRPLNAAFARLVAAPLAALASVFGIVGLAIGLGDDERDPSRGFGWIGFGAVWAFLALAAWLGARTTAAGETAAGP
jgi:hypothetical protein